jgi:hypothetical protein
MNEHAFVFGTFYGLTISRAGIRRFVLRNLFGAFSLWLFRHSFLAV